MNEYIEFCYDKLNNFFAKLHTEGKIRIVRDIEDLKKLIDICYNHGYLVQGDGFIDERACDINKDFIQYMNKRHKVLCILGKISDEMKLSKKNKTLGKRIIPGTLAAIVALSFATNKSEVQKTNEKNRVVSFLDEDINNNNNPMNENIIIEPENSMYYNLSESSISITTDENSHIYDDLEDMFANNAFHYSYEDRSNGAEISNAKRYEQTFEEYATQYGLDKNLLMAIAAQESCGEHYGNLDSGLAEGIMQIEKAVHIGSTIYAYNFNTGKVEAFEITQDNIRDLDTNIKVGAMILRCCLETYDYNIPIAVQAYNIGIGSMANSLEICSESEGLNKENMINDQSCNAWLNYRELLNTGDPKYVEHVFSYLENDKELKIQKKDGTSVSVKLINDNTKTNNLIN